MVELLAPPAPACFDVRSTWISYVQSAATEQRDDHEPGPLIFSRGVITIVPAIDATVQRPHGAPPLLIEKGREVRFNPAFVFCGECLAEWKADMQRAGRCKPTYLRDLLAPSEKK